MIVHQGIILSVTLPPITIKPSNKELWISYDEFASVEDALYAHPFLFLLALSHAHSLLVFLVELWLLCLVYLLPPSLLCLCFRFWGCLNFGLLFFRGVVFWRSESGEHFVDFLLVSSWLFFHILNDIVKSIFPFRLFFLFNDKIWEISFVDEIEICSSMITLFLSFLFHLFESIFDFPLFLELFILDLFVKILQVFLL